MLWIDYVIVGIVLLSALVSVLRGFMQEALSLAAWILAAWIALTFSDGLAGLLGGYIGTPTIRLVVAFAILFLVTIILGAAVNYLVGQLVRKTGLTGTDRMLGIIFGVARGAIIVAILVLLAGLTPLPREHWWKESLLVGNFQEIAAWARDYLPPDVRKNIVYD